MSQERSSNRRPQPSRAWGACRHARRADGVPSCAGRHEPARAPAADAHAAGEERVVGADMHAAAADARQAAAAEEAGRAGDVGRAGRAHAGRHHVRAAGRDARAPRPRRCKPRGEFRCLAPRGRRAATGAAAAVRCAALKPWHGQARPCRACSATRPAHPAMHARATQRRTRHLARSSIALDMSWPCRAGAHGGMLQGSRECTPRPSSNSSYAGGGGGRGPAASSLASALSLPDCAASAWPPFAAPAPAPAPAVAAPV